MFSAESKPYLLVSLQDTAMQLARLAVPSTLPYFGTHNPKAWEPQSQGVGVTLGKHGSETLLAWERDSPCGNVR